MTNTNQHPISLRDVLYELSLAKEAPDAELLDDFVRRYPEYADAIADFAVECVMESLRPQNAAEMLPETKVSPAVSRALSKYQNALHAVRSEEAAAQGATTSASVANPFTALNRDSFRTLAQQLKANTPFLCKLRDRQIDPRTISDGFRKFVAEKLKVAVEVIEAHLAGPSPQVVPQFYKADKKPVTPPQQTLEDAVRNSGLDEEQQRFLLSL